MTLAGVVALRAERDAFQWWAEPLYDADDFWALPSKCPGWSRLDVVSHLTDLFERVVDRTRAPSRDDRADRADIEVARRRGRPPLVVLGDYLGVAGPAIEQLAAWQEPVAGDRLVHFGAVGQHPTHLWADLLVFEHLVHRCFDLGGGTASFDSLVPAATAATSLLPQCWPALPGSLRAPVALVVGPPVDSTLVLRTVGSTVAVGTGGATDVAARVSMSAESYVGWVSGRGRRAWFTVDGDEQLAVDVLDATGDR